MKNKELITILVLLGILFVSFISALILNNFDGDINSSGNVSFDSPKTFQKSLTISKYANVTSVTMNISGNNPLDTFKGIYNETYYDTNGLNYNHWRNTYLLNDYNDTSYADIQIFGTTTGQQTSYIFNLSNINLNDNITTHYDYSYTVFSSGSFNVIFYLWNYSDNSFAQVYTNGSSSQINSNVTIIVNSSDFIKNNRSMFKAGYAVGNNGWTTVAKVYSTYLNNIFINYT